MPSVAIVGASRGIGRELVRQYLADGWTVHASVRVPADLSGATVHVADVTDEASLAAMADALPDGLDLVIANAGIGSREATLAKVDAAEWTRVMTVNALGPLLVARTVGRKLRRPGGTFAALTSRMGSIAENGGGAWSYRISKAALNMGLSDLAIEWAKDEIAVAALHPGWVQTDMGGAQAPLKPEDSVAGLRRVIAGLQGPGVRFLDYKGETIPW